jgi:hypothetical protein
MAAMSRPEVAVEGPRCSFLGRPTMRAASRLCPQTPSASTRAPVDGLLQPDGSTCITGAMSLTACQDPDRLKAR